MHCRMCIPAYQKVDKSEIQKRFEKAWKVKLSPKPGLTGVEIMNAIGEGKVKGLYIRGENPMLSDPEYQSCQRIVEKVGFSCSRGYLSHKDGGILADVVLPACGFTEKNGTFTNIEHRVQLLQKVVELLGRCRPDWEILCEVARRMGYEMGYTNAAEIMEEIASLIPIYGDIIDERLGENGLQWPCPDRSHPGSTSQYTYNSGAYPYIKGVSCKR